MTPCTNHPSRPAYMAAYPLCENCLAMQGQAIIDAGTYECLRQWARDKNYNWRQAMVRLGCAAQTPAALADLVNRADAAYSARHA